MQEAITQQLKAVQQASRDIVTLNDAAINCLLLDLADSIPAHQELILDANRKDLDRMDQTARETSSAENSADGWRRSAWGALELSGDNSSDGSLVDTVCSAEDEVVCAG